MNMQYFAFIFIINKESEWVYDEIILIEFIENNFLFKIKKSGNSKSIGFLFGLVESVKEDCNITEYSIQQTSLEQIFNLFVTNQGNNTNEIELKTEIEINKDCWIIWQIKLNNETFVIFYIYFIYNKYI